MTLPFAYSTGRNRTDAHPQVRRADTFDNLQDAWLSDRHDRPKDDAPYISRAFAINGDLRIRLFNHPHVEMNDVVLGNEPWGSAPAMVRVDRAVIALWLGHESVETTQIYLEATLAIKEHALAKATPPNGRVARYQPGDQLLGFLNNL
jgi:hypothetical protein